MSKFRADLHIHTVLSPCADLGMSPDQIIEQALTKKLDIIAITDHNSTLQCEIVRELAKDTNLVVLNGCEVNSSEEVHSLCLFEDDYTRNKFQKYIDAHLPHHKNDPEYHGYQVQVDKQNNIVQELPFYLGHPLNVGIEEIEKYVHQINGLFIPAHIDRPINSIFSQLGFLPGEMHFDALQISHHTEENEIRTKFDIHDDICVIKSSDAHYIEDIGIGTNIFRLNQPTFQEIRWAFHQKYGRSVKIDE